MLKRGNKFGVFLDLTLKRLERKRRDEDRSEASEEYGHGIYGGRNYEERGERHGLSTSSS